MSHWKSKLPPSALSYIDQLIDGENVSIQLSRPRKTKWGDFRSARSGKPSAITVNSNLTPFHFLIVFVHEWAHYLTWVEHKHRVRPHGIEWKTMYAQAMKPLLDQGVFPDALQDALKQSLINPSASSCRDLNLMRALGGMNGGSMDSHLIEHLDPGDRFAYNNRHFVVVKKARSRYHCREESSKRMFAFHALAEVEPMQ